MGNVRANNEDSYIICENKLKDLMFVVADGMGGHNAGEVASQIAVELMESAFNSLRTRPNYSEFLRDIIQITNDRVYKSSLMDLKYSNMGTTLSVLIISSNKIYIGHVGDSRIYAITDKEIIQLTQDHTLTQAMINNGSLQAKDASTNAFKNVLTQAIGTSKKVTISLKESHISMIKPIKFLLCSDGLIDEVDDKTIFDTMKKNENISTSIDNLLKITLSKSGKDNITIIGIDKKGVTDANI